MDSLIFSLNATIPIFLVMVVGYFLKQIGMIPESATKFIDKFVFKVTLPVLLFMDLATADFYSVWDGKYVLYCFLVTLICILLIWGIAALILKSSKITNRPKDTKISSLEDSNSHENIKKSNNSNILGEFVQGSYRSSAAVLGIAFISGIYGKSTIGPLMILGTVPLYNVMAVIILSFTDPDANGLNKAAVKKSLIGIATNPIILSIVLGMIFSLIRIPIPELLASPLNMIARITTPLALIGLGAGFEGRKALAKIGPTMIATFIKLILQCAIFLPVAVMLGFRGEHLVALLVMLGAPTTVSSYIMARNMNHEGVLTSSIIVATTFLSSLTLTFWLWLLRSQGLI